MMDVMKALLIVAGMAAGLAIPIAATAGPECPPPAQVRIDSFQV